MSRNVSQMAHFSNLCFAAARGVSFFGAVSSGFDRHLFDGAVLHASSRHRHIEHLRRNVAPLARPRGAPQDPGKRLLQQLPPTLVIGNIVEYTQNRRSS